MCNLNIDASDAREYLLHDGSICKSLGNARAVIQLPDGSYVTESFTVLRNAVHKIVLGSRAMHDYPVIWRSKINQFFIDPLHRGALAGLHTLNEVQESAKSFYTSSVKFMSRRRNSRLVREPDSRSIERMARPLMLALKQLDDDEKDRRQRLDGSCPGLGIAEYEIARAEIRFKLAEIDPGLASQVNDPM